MKPTRSRRKLGIVAGGLLAAFVTIVLASGPVVAIVAALLLVLTIVGLRISTTRSHGARGVVLIALLVAMIASLSGAALALLA